MKKRIITLLVAFLATIQGFSQVPIVESFEGAWPPTGWTITGFTQNVQRGYNSSKSADCNYSTPDGRITLPAYTATETTTLSFYLGCAYATYASDNVFTVEVSTSVESPSWQTVQTISYPYNDYDFLYNEINLGAYAGQEILVSLHVVPNYGANTVVDLVSLYEMSCPRPTNFVASNVTISSAELSWDAVTEASEYVLEVAAGSADWTNATTYTLTGTTYSLTDLSSGTTYYARIKSSCGEGEESPYTNSISFGTLCAESISTLPFTDEFNNLNCWTIMVEGDLSGYTYPEVGEEFSGNGTMLQTGADAMIALSSPLELDVTQAQFIFPLRAYEGSGTPTAQVGYVTDLSDSTSFVQMATWQIQNADHWEEYLLNTTEWVLDADSNYYIAIKFMPGSWGSMYLDNFSIQELPECPAPVRTSVSVVANATNATVSWIDNDPEHEAWTVYYREANAEEDVEWNEAPATEQSLIITDLTPETTYDVYVKTDCGTGDDNTDQTYTVQFTTTPAPITLPYFQDFEDEDAGSEFSYYTYDWYDEKNEWKIGSATAYLEEGETSGRSMYISSDNGATHSYVNTYCFSMAALLVEFEPGYEYSLEFDYLVNGESGSDVFKVFALDATQDLENYYNGISLTNELYGQTNWGHFSTGIPANLIGTTKQIIFYWKNDSSLGNQPPAAIDNIQIIPTTCIRPANVEVTEITGTTATITWEGTADQYTVTYHPVNDASAVTTAETSETSIEITDLTPATSYVFTLQSTCDDELSPVSAEYSFFTSCDPIETPFWFEDFESVLGDEEAANVKFSCWNVLQATQSSWNGAFPRIYWEGYEESAHSGEVSLEFKGDGFLLLPEFAFSTDELQLSFYANTTAATAEAAGIFEVGYVTDAMDTSTFVSVAVVAPVGFERSSSEYVGPFVFTEATEGSRIALRYKAVLTGDLESWNLDDFTVQPVSDCPAPNFTSVTVTGITDLEAMVSWVDEDVNHTQWKVFYKAETDTEYTVVTATEQSIVLTELEPATRYSVYVQTDCGSVDNFDRTAEVTFMTRALPLSEFPYIQDFQDLEATPFAVEYYGTGFNQWVIGSATGMSSTEELSSLYISNNQSNYSYTIANESRSYVVMPIQFGDDLEYSISFDYKVGGEEDYDYLSVRLCDGSVEISENAGIPDGIDILNQATMSDWTNVSYTSTELSGAYKLLVFYWRNDDGWGNGVPAAIDNIKIEGANCPVPEAFALTSKTAEEATFTWTAPEEMTSWTLYYKEALEEEYTSVDVTENPFTLTELEPQTQYLAYLVTNCDGEPSVSSNIVSFTTECVAVDEFPYYEGFESENLLCWRTDVISGGSNNTDWEVVPSSHYTPISGSSFIIYQGEGGGVSSRLVSPMFDMSSLTAPYLKFNYVNKSWYGDQDVMTVQYRTSSTEEWVTLATYNTHVESWTLDSIALPSQSETYQISFLGVSNYGYGVALDDFTIYDANAEEGGEDPEPEPCDAPTNLTVSNITENSADISWNGTASAYELKLNGGEAETLTTTSKQLIGLPDNFTITVEVRAVCENQTSEWVSTTFTTLPAQGGEDPQPEPCEPPTNLIVSNITENSADVSWNGTATTYELKLNGGAAETLTTTSKQLIGLPDNFTITVEVRAICEDQQSAWVSTTFTTLPAQGGEDPQPEPCEPPTSLVASNITETTAEITWNGTATTYELKVNGGEAETLTATTKALTGLTPATAYTVEVRAICEDQTSAWVSTNFTTLEEQVVITLGEVTTSPATEVGNTSATLNGALVNAGNAENFTVGFALSTTADFTLEDADVQNIVATLTDATFSQAVTDLAEGQTYFFRAYITNEAGTAYGAVETFTLSSLADAMENTLQVSVYPNPATTQATLKLAGLQSDAKIVISDLQGRILSQDEISASTTTYTIDLNNMASGVYYIRIVADETISTQKLIVE